jgi:hypothetical protein
MLAVIKTPLPRAAPAYLARFLIIIANRHTDEGETIKVFGGFIKEGMLAGR